MKAKALLYSLISIGVLVAPNFSLADAVSDDVLQSQYEARFARTPPTKAQLGVDLLSGMSFRLKPSAEEMATFYSDNVRGRPPVVYAVEYFTRSASYVQVVAHFSQFADPATEPQETTNNGIRSTTIELAKDGNPKQKILVRDATNGYKCVLDDYGDSQSGAPCVYVKIVSRGEASWAAAGRGQPRPVVAQAPNNRSNVSNNQTTNNQSNNQNNNQNCQNTSRNAGAAALGSALGMLGRGYSAGTAVNQGAATYDANRNANCH